MNETSILSKAAQEKIDKLPFFIRYVICKLVDCIDDLINGKCDEQLIVNAMSTLENNAKGRYSGDDLLNYDKAGEVLGFGTTNRVGLKRLLDKHGIHEVKIGNTKVGFRRDEVMALKDKINEQIRGRNLKRKARKSVIELRHGIDNQMP